MSEQEARNYYLEMYGVPSLEGISVSDMKYLQNKMENARVQKNASRDVFIIVTLFIIVAIFLGLTGGFGFAIFFICLGLSHNFIHEVFHSHTL